MNFPCPRSQFKIEKYGNKDCNNPIINYGDKIFFVAHENSFDKPLYLNSILIGTQSYSRISRNQEVLVNSERSYNACWMIEHPDCTLRYSMEGKPVYVTDPFILRHASTGRLLASDLVDYYNDYGHEYEVCCHNFTSSNKYQTLDSEKNGQLKIDTNTRTENDQNIWVIIDRMY